MPNISAW